LGHDLADEDFIDDLTRFGLSHEEARIVLFLLRVGGAPASIVANRFKLNRVKIYRIMSALEEKGWVELVLGRPVRYVAKPLDSVLNACIEETRKNYSTLEEKKASLIELSRTLKTDSLPEEPRFKIIRGRPNAFEDIGEMVKRAKHRILYIYPAKGLEHLTMVGIDNMFKAASERRVRIEMLGPVSEEVITYTKHFMDFSEIRFFPLQTPLRLLIVDGKEVFMTLSIDDDLSLDSPNDTGIWTNAIDFAKGMTSSFDAIWKGAPPIEQILNQLELQNGLKEGLKIVRDILKESGWRVESPGTIIGESGSTHSYDLAATSVKTKKAIVFDVLNYGESMSQIMALNIKSLDVEACTSFLITARTLSTEEAAIVGLHDLRVLHITDPKNLIETIRKRIEAL